MRAYLFAALVAAPLTAAAAPALVWSEQGPDDAHAAVFAQAPGGQRRVLATVPVTPGYEPVFRVSPDGSALFGTALAGSRDLDRGAILWRIGLGGGEPRALDHAVALLAPVALPRDRAAYLKVAAVTAAAPEASRRGELDRVTAEVRLARADGSTATLATDTAHGLHLAGAVGETLLVYRVAAEEAAFYALRIEPGARMRRLAAAPAGPFARDFSVRGRQLVFASRTPDARGWAVYALDVDSGATSTLFRAESEHPAPVVAGRDILFVSPARDGAALSSWDGAASRTVVEPGGIPFPLAVDASARVVAYRRQLPEAQQLWMLDRRRARATPLPTRGFFSVAGFAELP